MRYLLAPLRVLSELMVRTAADCRWRCALALGNSRMNTTHSADSGGLMASLFRARPLAAHADLTPHNFARHRRKQMENLAMTRSRLSFALAALCSFIILAAADNARAELLYGLTQGQQLVTFDSDSRQINTAVAITGLGSRTLIGLDFRPSTGELYGLGLADTVGGQNRFFKINTATGAAQPLGSTFALFDSIKSFDFDPVNDNIRLLTNLKKNVRVNPNTGAISSQDMLLNFAIGDPNAGAAPEVVTGAYTNSYAGAGSATLYNLEASKDVLTIQSPQNNGTLTTVGSLGLQLGTLLNYNGMDISGQTGIGYVVGQTLVGQGLTQNTLYTIDLATGAIQVAGPIAGTPQAGPLTFGGGYEPPPTDPYDCGGIQGAGLLIDVATVPAVPEPSTFVLAGFAGLAVVVAARRKARSRA
jgi:hypothetical protein